MKDFIKVMKALSDPNRVRILKMLQYQALCVCEMQAALDIAQPTVSSHLKVLEGAGLVGYRKTGLWAYYHLTEGAGTPYSATMLGSLKHWLKDDPEIVRLLESLPVIRQKLNAGICLARARQTKGKTRRKCLDAGQMLGVNQRRQNRFQNRQSSTNPAASGEQGGSDEINEITAIPWCAWDFLFGVSAPLAGLSGPGARSGFISRQARSL